MFNEPVGRGFSKETVGQGATVPSSATTNIWGGGDSLHITGTTTITSLGTAPYAGATKRIIFDGALTLTHGANLNLPGAANITTVAGDSCLVYADTTTQLDIFDYTKVSARPDVASSNAGAVTLGTGSTGITSIDMGTVISGDRIMITGYYSITGGTGNSTLTVVKSAGTATTVVADSATFLQGVRGPSTITLVPVAGIIKVTAGGTLTIAMYGSDSGGTASVAIGAGQLHGMVLK